MKRVLVYSMLFLKSTPLKGSLIKFEFSFLVNLLQGTRKEVYIYIYIFQSID